MFRALLRSSSGGQICISTESGLVTLFRLLFSTQVKKGLCTEQSPKDSDDTRCCTNTKFYLLRMSTIVLETCTGM